jgi:hypothetical protein
MLTPRLFCLSSVSEFLFVRGYWFAPTHTLSGPSLLEHLRFPLHRLYQFRLDADYDLVPVSSASAEECVRTVQRTIAEIDQRTPGAPS